MHRGKSWQRMFCVWETLKWTHVHHSRMVTSQIWYREVLRRRSLSYRIRWFCFACVLRRFVGSPSPALHSQSVSAGKLSLPTKDRVMPTLTIYKPLRHLNNILSASFIVHVCILLLLLGIVCANVCLFYSCFNSVYFSQANEVSMSYLEM